MNKTLADSDLINMDTWLYAWVNFSDFFVD